MTKATEQASQTISVTGNNNTIASASNAEGARVAAASGSSNLDQQIHAAVRVLGAESAVAKAIADLHFAISSSQLAASSKTDALELLSSIASQATLPSGERKPATANALGAALRETLGTTADVLQVWTTFWPVIAGWMGVAVR